MRIKLLKDCFKKVRASGLAAGLAPRTINRLEKGLLAELKVLIKSGLTEEAASIQIVNARMETTATDIAALKTADPAAAKQAP